MSFRLRRRPPPPPPTRLELLDQAYRALDDVWRNADKDRRGLPDDFFSDINLVQMKLMEAWENEAERQRVSRQWAEDWNSEEDGRYDQA
jgi:hypothetical protein